MDKRLVLQKICQRLQEELAFVIQSAEAARHAATHEESKAEDQYDTRGLEASYLAGAQAQRAAELQKLVHGYQKLLEGDGQVFEPATRVAPWSLVELECDGARTVVFLVPQGAGITVEVEGTQVQLITLQSPLGEELVGRRAGDSFEVETRAAMREYEILSVQ